MGPRALIWVPIEPTSCFGFFRQSPLDRDLITTTTTTVLESLLPLVVPLAPAPAEPAQRSWGGQ